MTANTPFRLTERAASIRALARELMDSHGLAAWEFGFNTNVRRAGVCFYAQRGEPGRIELSSHFAERNDDDEVYPLMDVQHVVKDPVGPDVGGGGTEEEHRVHQPGEHGFEPL